MSIKQDRAYARTAQDIERKYAFGKSFNEVLGIVSDFRNEVESVESTLRSEMREQSTTLKRDTEQIVATAKKEISDTITELSSEVELKLDADAVTIIVEKEMANGVDRVVTKTGYEFGDDGLDISKSGDEMSNKLDNTGMYVKKSGDDILVANNKGVAATDLHAKTYLIIGSGDGKSRFEDYGINRTGCFWVGG
jgi:hypothetical protein